ncbi:MAG: cytochrome d ubiquinol oxidase subunit II [Anaerolineae bacterium]|nr:cytochrome d ubiquinol oxidase subunit II [Phycisphaerae bacterium]
MIPVLLDYETLRVLWWLLLGGLLIGFALTDGYDLGMAALLPFVARNEDERKHVLETVEPIWEGNQVWLITAGAASFAAWPPLYAVSFSGFYLALFLVLLALIVRPVGFGFRSKIDDARWRAWWDGAICIGGIVPALIFGVAFGNLLLGVPFSFDGLMRATYTGSLIELLNPFALLCGLVSLSMLAMHGGTWVAMTTDGVIAARARQAAMIAGLATIVLFAAGGLATSTIDGYRIAGDVVSDGPSNPLAKTVLRESGAWLTNYGSMSWTLLAPIFGFLGAGLAIVFTRAKRPALAFAGSSLSLFGIVATPGLAMFPFLLPSSTTPDHSLTVWDASSSPNTLWTMLLVTAVFLPIILAYTSWVLRVVFGPAKHDSHL